jgi:hypothetical protein
MAKRSGSSSEPHFGPRQPEVPTVENLAMRMFELRQLREQVKDADARQLKQSGSGPATTRQAHPRPFRSRDQ